MSIKVAGCISMSYKYIKVCLQAFDTVTYVNVCTSRWSSCDKYAKHGGEQAQGADAGKTKASLLSKSVRTRRKSETDRRRTNGQQTRVQ